MVADDLNSEFIGIVNYCLIALIQMQIEKNAPTELEKTWVMKRYDEESQKKKMGCWILCGAAKKRSTCYCSKTMIMAKLGEK